MRYDIAQIVGMVVVVLSGQGVIRLLIDHGDTGLIGWLPGGFGAILAGYLVLLVAGVLVTGWAHTGAKRLGRR